MSQLILLLIILIEGFVTISAEILTIRQLIPVAGNSVIVTSLIIGVFLLFLAYGYRQGGRVSKDYYRVLKRNFTLSAIGLGIGLSYVFIFWFFAGFRQYIASDLLISLTSYLLIITAPLVYILGQTVPITMNLIQQSETSGATGGRILHLSTLGSFLGAILTSLLLMHFLGVAWTVFINCCLLTFLTLLLFTDKKQDTIRAIVLFATLILAYRFNIAFENQVFVKTNAYANYEVVTRGETRVLYSNESPSSLLDKHNKAFPYIELIKRILFEDLQFKDKNILVLGAGGFTLSADKTFGNHFDYVDVDKDIKDIVEKHYSPKIKGEFIAQDARLFLQESPKRYDAIISDVYSSFRTIPAHLLTREYFELVNKNLNESGVALFNIIIRPTLKDDYSKKINTTLLSVFQQCMIIPLKYVSEITNVIYVCQKNNSLPTKSIYTDNLNQVTFDFFKSMSNQRSNQ